MQKSSKSWVNIKDSLERSLARHLEGVKNAFESEFEENGEKLSLLSKSLQLFFLPVFENGIVFSGKKTIFHERKKDLFVFQ